MHRISNKLQLVYHIFWEKEKPLNEVKGPEGKKRERRALAAVSGVLTKGRKRPRGQHGCKERDTSLKGQALVIHGHGWHVYTLSPSPPDLNDRINLEILELFIYTVKYYLFTKKKEAPDWKSQAPQQLYRSHSRSGYPSSGREPGRWREKRERQRRALVVMQRRIHANQTNETETWTVDMSSNAQLLGRLQGDRCGPQINRMRRVVRFAPLPLFPGLETKGLFTQILKQKLNIVKRQKNSPTEVGPERLICPRANGMPPDNESLNLCELYLNRAISQPLKPQRPRQFAPLACYNLRLQLPALFLNKHQSQIYDYDQVLIRTELYSLE